MIKAPFAQGMFDVTKRAKQHWGMHVECVTNIIPGWNDSDSNLKKTASWIAENLGDDTPWHVTRFFPYGELSDIPPTEPSTLQRAVKFGKDAGLNFVYLGNIATQTGENTYCPTCGTLCVERSGYSTRIVGLSSDGKCEVDDQDINIHM